MEIILTSATGHQGGTKRKEVHTVVVVVVETVHLRRWDCINKIERDIEKEHSDAAAEFYPSQVQLTRQAAQWAIIADEKNLHHHCS